jgi:thiamine-phosphate pyrophosphorylase
MALIIVALPLESTVAFATFSGPMHGLYAILDLDSLDARHVDPIEAAHALAEVRPACIQLRAKHAGSRRTLELLRAIVAVAARFEVPIFGNDRADLALLAKAHGVHVGQLDAPPGLAKHLASERGESLLVGLSTHDRDQLHAAIDEPLDYVALGPVFATSSKEDSDPVLGLDLAIELARESKMRRPGLPICAIGGISIESAARLAGAFDLIAVIGALLGDARDATGPAAIAANARALAAAIEGGRSRTVAAEASP